MPSLSERERNNIRAGVFVSISLIACMAVIIALTNVAEAIFHSTTNYVVTFPVSSGVGNLKSGSEVRIGGVRKGKVADVIAPFDKDGGFRTIGVEFKLDQEITLYENAIIVVGLPIIGNDAWLDIPNVGDASAALPPGNSIKGTPSVGLITTLVGSENAGKVDEIVSHVTNFSKFVGGIEQEYHDRYVPIIDNVGLTVTDVKHVVADLRERHWTNWTDAVSKVLAWAAEATATIDTALASATGMFDDARGVIGENRENINKTIASVESASNRINTETIDQFHALLNSGQKAMDAATPVLQSLRDDYPIWSADVSHAMANANLASQQLKLMMIEARRAPWKLLYRPTTQEVEHELLYDSVRSFALAAGELRATSEAVKRILADHPERVGSDESIYHRLEKLVTDDLEAYQKAQQQMMDVLLKEGGR